MKNEFLESEIESICREIYSSRQKSSERDQPTHIFFNHETANVVRQVVQTYSSLYHEICNMHPIYHSEVAKRVYEGSHFVDLSTKESVLSILERE